MLFGIHGGASAITADRANRFSFHQRPALYSWSQMFSTTASTYTSPAQLGGTRIAVLSDGVQESYLKELASGFGLTIDILLARSLAAAAAWSSHPLLSRLSVAVNISARQLHDDAFVDDICNILDATGANANLLGLELTETLLVPNVEEAIVKMGRLYDRGVRFSLDDFGTGYLSMNYLKRLPLERLKIDKSFVRDLLTDANDAAIVRTIVALGESLGLAVIAEGVETAAQRDMLAASGCCLYQGYLFSHPVPAAQLEAGITHNP